MSTTTKELRIKVSAAAMGFDSAQRSIRKLTKEAVEAQGASAVGPGGRVSTRKLTFEQQVRNEQAQRIKAMRDSASRQLIREEAERRMFGATRQEIEAQEKASRAAEESRRKKVARDIEAARASSPLNLLAAASAAERRSGRSGGRSGGGSGPLSLGQQGARLGLSGDTSIPMMMRGGGALIGVHMLGQALQKTPESLNKFREALRTGTTPTEAFANALADTIPVVGGLARGFQSVGQMIGDLITGRDRGREEQDKADAKAGNVTRRRRDDKRASILFDSSETVREDAFGFRAGDFRDEFNRQRGAIDNEFRKKMLELDRESAKRSALSPDQQQKFDEDLSRRRDIATRTRDSRLFDVDRAAGLADQDQQGDITGLERERRQHGRDKADSRRQFDMRMLDLQEELLEEMGGQHKLEAERTAVRKRIAEKDREFIRLMEDPNLSTDQRRKLGDLRELLPALQREMFSNVGRTPEPRNQTQLNNSRFLTGVGNPLEGAARKTEKNTEVMAKFLRQIVDFMRRGQNNGGGGAIASPF